MPQVEDAIVLEYDKENEKYRIMASISFAAMLILVGFPLWWKTTEVYRVPLPYAEIAALKDLNVKVSMNVFIAAEDGARADILIDELHKQYASSALFNIRFLNANISKAAFAEAKTPAMLETAILLAYPVRVGDFVFIEWKKLSEDVLVTAERSAYFASDTSASKIGQVLNKWILHVDSVTHTINTMKNTNVEDSTALEITQKGSRHERHRVRHFDSDFRSRVPPSPAYDVVVTVVNPDPDKLKLVWDLPRAVNQYLAPFLSELKILANFTLKSQWLYLVSLDIRPKQVPDKSPLGRHYALAEDILPHLITPLEKKLASHVSRNPCLNLVLYAPSCDMAPLHIYNRKGVKVISTGGIDAFLSPRWGGLVVSNPPDEVCVSALENSTLATLTPDTSSVMGTFLLQTRRLLGITTNEPINSASIVPLESLEPRAWEKDGLLRVWALEQITSASLTLQSIAQLLGEINNIVINDKVGASINTALESCKAAAESLVEGSLESGLLHANKAFVASEAAFTDPSLLALLYFPDDQKYAVYIPLFLPVMIPVLMSLASIKNWFFPKK